ncbi:catechol 2,3-dioxygenase-like lactoylglutathione lyase family enzyme [Bacillus tianshenii]|uniref:Catechol 2,3-dioxygenase-like lactoylglutathione lyase family enzyme n=1 Tax=Sutcliffiella tianshenii TaxID=1463404 RepID=A0ABS2NVT1_9BACI|nr:VOC family protein [Bacillus tianshenii]MBM7618756.1 catechol 2,3-dioxygenase-like lactoylglutathione lyase family enzyme [Bacillus tianshenii]
MKINQVGQIGIPVKDFERGVAFYKEKLALPLLFSTGNLAFFDCNGVRLLLSLPEKEGFANASSILYFTVEDIKGSYEEMLEKDVRFLDEPHVVAKMGDTETWMAFFSDEEGNTHALMSEVTVS